MKLDLKTKKSSGLAIVSRFHRRCYAAQGDLTTPTHLYTNTTGSPSAKSALTMITLTKPRERKGWRGDTAITVIPGRRSASVDATAAVCWRHPLIRQVHSLQQRLETGIVGV